MFPSAHTFKHSFASHLLQVNYDICTIQELLGGSNLKNNYDFYPYRAKRHGQTSQEFPCFDPC